MAQRTGAISASAERTQLAARSKPAQSRISTWTKLRPKSSPTDENVRACRLTGLPRRRRFAILLTHVKKKSARYSSLARTSTHEGATIHFQRRTPVLSTPAGKLHTETGSRSTDRPRPSWYNSGLRTRRPPTPSMSCDDRRGLRAAGTACSEARQPDRVAALKPPHARLGPEHRPCRDRPDPPARTKA